MSNISTAPDNGTREHGASFTDQVLSRMQELNLTRRRLAFLLRTTPAYVTKLLGEDTNPTVETMAKVSQALEAELHVQLVPKDSAKKWSKIIDKIVPLPAPAQQVWAKVQQKRVHSNDAGEGLLGSVARTQALTCIYERIAASA